MIRIKTRSKLTEGRRSIICVRVTRVGLFLLLVFSSTACSKIEHRPASNTAAAEAKKDRADLRTVIKKIEPFFKPLGKPKAYEWLASHNEPGQTFDQYLDSEPTRPTKERGKIYVQPLGTFTQQQKKIIDVTAGYIAAFFGIPVSMLPSPVFSTSYPNVRQNNLTKTRQTKTGYILDTVLKPILPADAAALIAFTADDLYSDETMNYVFGRASLENRVGVWSLSRLDNNASYDTFLRRTLKIAVHETGHMFSMRHCTKYECVMSGTNQLAETDSRPIDACPECMAKVCWLSDIAPTDRYDRLAGFCRKNGMKKEADEFQRKSAAVKKN